MDFYVPTVGDEIYLEEAWTFPLYHEGRNESMFKRIGGECYAGRGTYGEPGPEVTLPVGTQLTIDRIYIRGKGVDYRRFDSITFRIKQGGCEAEPKFEKARFWVKLRDANRIVCDLYPIVDTEARKRFHRFANLGE
jgi:hypothetical protein